MKKIIKEFLNDVAVPFAVYSAIGIVAVFSVTFVVRLSWVVMKCAWNLI